LRFLRYASRHDQDDRSRTHVRSGIIVSETQMWDSGSCENNSQAGSEKRGIMRRHCMRYKFLNDWNPGARSSDSSNDGKLGELVRALSRIT